MELIQQVPEVSAYLAADEAIDHEHPLVRETVAELRGDTTDAYAYASAAYAFVRDTITHSADSGDMRVTWRASRSEPGRCYCGVRINRRVRRPPENPPSGARVEARSPE